MVIAHSLLMLLVSACPLAQSSSAPFVHDSLKQSDANEMVDYEWEGHNDMESLRELFLESFLQNYQNLGLTLEDLATNDIAQVLKDYWNVELASFKNRPVRWIVAKVRGEIAGFASFNLENAPEEVYVQLLYVLPKYQRQGIGKNLLYSIFQIKDNIRKLSLITRRVNSSAISFYERLGFRENALINKEANIDIKLCIQLEKAF